MPGSERTSAEVVEQRQPRLRSRPATERGEATREALVEAAIDVFLDVGYAHARVPEISRRAGVGYGTFYLYFESKLDLAKQVLEEVWVDVRRGALLRDETEPWPSRIRKGVEHTLDAHWRHERTFRALWGGTGFAPDLGATRERLLGEDVDILTHNIERELANGYKPFDEPRMVSLAVNAMCDEAARRWVLAGGNPPREELADALTDACMLLLTGHA